MAWQPASNPLMGGAPSSSSGTITSSKGKVKSAGLKWQPQSNPLLDPSFDKTVVSSQSSPAPIATAPPTSPTKSSGKGLLHSIGAYTSSLVHAPGGAIHDIRTGQRITDFRNGAIIVKRAPLDKTQAVVKEQGGSNQNGQQMQLDHVLPLELGGTNDKNNLKLIPKSQDAANSAVENYLGNQVKANKLKAQDAKQLIIDYKNNKITADQVYKRAQVYQKAPPVKLAGFWQKYSPANVGHEVATAGREIAQGTARGVEELVPSAIQLATGKAPPKGGQPMNKAGQFIFGKAPIQSIQQEGQGAKESHPGGFHIKGTPITLTPKETGAAQVIGKTGLDLLQAMGIGKGAKAKVDNLGAKTEVAKTTANNAQVNTLLDKIRPANPSPDHFPVQNTNMGAKAASDLSYRGTPTGQGRGVAKELNISEGQPIAEQRSPTIAPTEGLPTATSKVAKDIEARAIEQKLTTGFKDLAGYNPTTHAEEVAKVANLITGDTNKALRIARGEEALPTDISGSKLIKGLEAHAYNTKQPEILTDLAKSPLASGVSHHAQELALANEKDISSPVAAIQKVLDARAKAASARTGKTVEKVASEATKEIKASTPKVTRQDWHSFVESLKC